MPYRGIIPSSYKTDRLWIVWMTESSPIGEGIVGTYDDQLKLREVTVTRPIRWIRCVAVNDETELLLIRKISGTGTGLYEEDMSIFEVGNLKSAVWSGQVYSWLEGLEGRNEGHLAHAIVALRDLDVDGTKELLVINLKQVETDMETIMFAQRNVQCEVFSFDAKRHKYCVQKEACPVIVYPLGASDEEKF
jgi:hypothetical protein